MALTSNPNFLTTLYNNGFDFKTDNSLSTIGKPNLKAMPYFEKSFNPHNLSFFAVCNFTLQREP